MCSSDLLIELIVNADVHDSYECKLCTREDTSCIRCGAGKLADHLIANGVVVPPCKVGDTVYEFGCDDPFEDPLDLYVVESTVSGIAIFTSEDLHNMNCLGKTVFLTKEEAEAKLKEMNKDA